MHRPSLQSLIAIAALAAALPAAAQASPMAWSLGYSSFKLRPTSGTNQQMNGWALGAEYRTSELFSVEAILSRQTGTEADTIDLRQIGILAGLKLILARHGRFQPYDHLLIGQEQLRASEPGASDQRTSLALGPGAGVDVALTPQLAARAQVDVLFTNYSGQSQASPSLFVGVVYRR